MRDAYLDRLPIAGRLVSENFAGWPPSLREEFARGGANGKVGQHLLSETSRLRVWRSGWRRANGCPHTVTSSTTPGPR